MILTATMLRSIGAYEVNKFVATFGEQAEVTPENVRRAYEAGFNVAWLAAYREWNEHDQIMVSAWHRCTDRYEFEEMTEPAWVECLRVMDAAWEECNSGDWAALAARIVAVVKSLDAAQGVDADPKPGIVS